MPTTLSSAEATAKSSRPFPPARASARTKTPSSAASASGKTSPRPGPANARATNPLPNNAPRLRYNFSLMHRIQCRGLLIDMDGVLVDSTAAIARVWTRWAARHNMDPAYVIHFAHGRMSPDSVRELLPNVSPEVHNEEIDWMERGEIEDIADVFALPGAGVSLQVARAPSRSVVPPASRPLAEARLRAAGLWELITHIVTPSDSQRGKRPPEPYQKGAALLRLPPAVCVVIEDAAS